MERLQTKERKGLRKWGSKFMFAATWVDLENIMLSKSDRKGQIPYDSTNIESKKSKQT